MLKIQKQRRKERNLKKAAGTRSFQSWKQNMHMGFRGNVPEKEAQGKA